MIELTVKTLDSQNHAFTLEDDITVRGFKEHIAEAVSVPADLQRLIYCGRVLQDEKKLNDYDVNGKVIHLVQRAPPQSGQSNNGSSSSQGQNQGEGPGWAHMGRPHFHHTRAQLHGNAMYFSAMSVPSEVVDGHGIPLPQLSNTLSTSRLLVASRMLNETNQVLNRLDNPNATPEEQNAAASAPQQEVEGEEIRNAAPVVNIQSNGAIAAALSAAINAMRGNNEATGEASASTTNQGPSQSNSQTSSQSQSQSATPEQQQQQQPQSNASSQSTGSNAGQSGGTGRRTQQLPRPSQMAELLDKLTTTQDRMRPYLDRYRTLMQNDPAPVTGAGANSVEENQRIIDGASESLHFMSHACHALSDIIVDMGQQPPRNLRCRPIIIQQSAIWQAGTPIQVEAQISFQGRNSNNSSTSSSTANSSNAEGAESTTTPTSTPRSQESAATSAETPSAPASSTTAEQQSQGSSNASSSQPQNDQPQAPQQQPRRQTQVSVVLGNSPPSLWNLPSIEVLMEVGADRNTENGTGNEQGESNGNNNNNSGGAAGRAGENVLNSDSWGSIPSTDFMRNLMQVVAGHIAQSNVAATTTAARTTAAATATDNAAGNQGQSTQARSNVGTHPTTATQTRSSSRPHVFHPQAQAFNVGLGQGLEFDLLLPCNSHHVRRSNGGANATATNASAQSTRTSGDGQADPNSSQPSPAASSRFTTRMSPAAAHHSTHLPSHIRSRPNSSSASRFAPHRGHNLAVIIRQLSGVFGTFSRTGLRCDTPGTLHNLIRGLFASEFGYSESDRNIFMDVALLLARVLSFQHFTRLLTAQDSGPLIGVRQPLRQFLRNYFPGNPSTERVQQLATDQLIQLLRPHYQRILRVEESRMRPEARNVDLSATVESLFRNFIVNLLQSLFNENIADSQFATFSLERFINLIKQICFVLRHSLQGEQEGLEAVALRYANNDFTEQRPSTAASQDDPYMRIVRLSRGIAQPCAHEVQPLLVLKKSASQPLSTSANQEEPEPMEVEPVLSGFIVEDKSNSEENDEEVPKTFPGHEALPSDWVPIIARDGVRQRRQMQEMAGAGGVSTLSDAYLGGLPSKRRKLIEKQKPRLLAEPTPNQSPITASVERLVRDGVVRAGVDEVEGAAVAVAADPAVRAAFGQAVRECLQPQRCVTPDFPDSRRFPNASKYFTEQNQPPK